MDFTHDPATESWVDGADGHPDFPIQNLPFCVFTLRSESEDRARGGVRIGDQLVDLAKLASSGLLDGNALLAARAAAVGTLNGLFELGATPRKALRAALYGLLSKGSPQATIVAEMLSPVTVCSTHLPARIGDYTDFYAGIHHAQHVGALFRPENPLPPNYKWVPIGYHGRASTVQPTGKPIHRPNGQLKSPAADVPTFSPTQRLDYELELGVWMSASPTPGRLLGVGRAAEQIAGYCLLNDWSARDIQTWEYQPLGPFLAKNFATTVSAYVVTPEALEPFGHECTRPAADPKPLPYLYDAIDEATGGLNVDLEVGLSSETMRANGMAEVTVCRSSTTNLYWTIAQLIAHHSSGGCELQAGDLLGSGTISTPGDEGLGSLLELSATGPIKLPNGETRTFLLDGDEVVMRGRASRPGYASVGFGECRARVLGPRKGG